MVPANTYTSTRTHQPAGSAVVTIKIDDEKPDERGHCQIYVTGESPNTFTLELRKCPLTDEVREFVESDHGSLTSDNIELELSVTDVGNIRDLAKVIRRTVGRGHHYENPNWKSICRRTADSLDQFATHLFAYGRDNPRNGAQSPGSTTPQAPVSPVTPTPTATIPSSGNTRARKAKPYQQIPDDENLFIMLGIE